MGEIMAEERSRTIQLRDVCVLVGRVWVRAQCWATSCAYVVCSAGTRNAAAIARCTRCANCSSVSSLSDASLALASRVRRISGNNLYEMHTTVCACLREYCALCRDAGEFRQRNNYN